MVDDHDRDRRTLDGWDGHRLRCAVDANNGAITASIDRRCTWVK
jgi:hypothetical protein